MIIGLATAQQRAGRPAEARTKAGDRTQAAAHLRRASALLTSVRPAEADADQALLADIG